MNTTIERCFNSVEIRLIRSPVISAYWIRRREITPADEKLRIKASLINGGIIEMFEYVTESGGEIQLSKYSIHWQNEERQLRQRWDNAPHHPELPNFPHHVHYENGRVEIPDTISIVEYLEKTVRV